MFLYSISISHQCKLDRPLATVSKFLTGKPVDFATFEELCQSLALDWREIADLEFEVPSQTIDKTSESSKLNCTNQERSPLYPSGAVRLDSPYYIERYPIDKQVYQEIRKPGALVRIKAPREMGKTSLLLRVLDYAKRQGYRTVSLNLEQVDQEILRDLDKFLRWLCANIARQFQLKPKLNEYWDEDLGSKISCTFYFEDYLLKSIATPLVFALDEMNQIFEHPQIAKDFLPLLRSWYEKSKILPIWQILRLIVVHSTEIYVPLDINRSPFNVGLPIQLTHFSLDEVQQLTQRYGVDWLDREEIRQLMNLIGGHPALVHTAIYHLSFGKITLAQLLETASTTTGIYCHHLQRHRIILQEQPELANALNTVINATDPVELESILAYKLGSMGLIQQSGNKAIPGCNLYQQYFAQRCNS
ncbi:MAG: AAA-like domain-containing protein [Cyanobacteria bacterium P01_G01_bin.49]